MASAKYGSIITELKGKIGGNVFQGSYATAVVKKLWGYRSREPIGYTDARRKKLTAYAHVSQTWRTLTDTERNAWSAAAASFPAKNKFGDTYTPSGYQIYMSFNTNMYAMGGDLLTEPPSPPEFPSWAPVSLYTLNITTIEFNGYDNTLTDFRLRVLATAPYSPGAKYARGGYKNLGAYLYTAADGIQVQTKYEQIFGPIIQGQRISFKCKWVQVSTGITSAFQEFTGIVSA